MEKVKKILGENYTEEVKQAIEQEIASQVEKGGADYVPKAKYNEVNERYKGVKSELDARDRQIEELKPKAAGNEALLEQISQLQEENKRQGEEAVTKLRNKYLDDKINSYKPISARALKAELDLDKVEFDEDFNIKGLDEQVDVLKEDEKLNRLFEQEETPPPTGTGLKNGEQDPTQTEPILKTMY